MKLPELLKDLFEERHVGEYFTAPDLSHDELELMKDALMKCDEFKEATEFVILTSPFVDNDKNKVIKTDTIKISEGLKFKNRVYLYSIMQTPELFDPKTINLPVKNGACITPTLYNAITFAPFRKIIMDISTAEQMEKKAIHALLDDMLDNPKDYTPKGIRGIKVRGIFETIVTKETETDYDIGEVNLNNPKFFSVACLESKTIGDEIFLNVETKYIPLYLKELFLNTFVDDKLKNITVKEIDDFLSTHK